MKKQKINHGPLMGWVFLAMYFIILAVVYSFVYDDFLKTKNSKLAGERDLIKAEYDLKKTLIDSIPSLDKEIEKLMVSMNDNIDNYFADVPQEKFMYLFKALRDKSGADIQTLAFTDLTFVPEKQDIFAGRLILDRANMEKYLRKQKNIEDSVATIDVTDEELKNFIVDMKLEKVIVTMRIIGNYQEFKKFYNYIDSNREAISISNLQIKRPGFMSSILPLDDIYMYDSNFSEPTIDTNLILDGKNILSIEELEKGIEEMGKVTADMTLVIYKVPSISKYKEQEIFYSWELKSSRSNPFSYLDIFLPVLKKDKIFIFDKVNYKILTSGTKEQAINIRSDSPKSDISKNETNDVSNVASIDITYDTESVDPKILIDLIEHNISVEDQVTRLGVQVFSEKPNNNKISLSMTDSNNNNFSIVLSDYFTFKGWASLGGKVPKTAVYPLKIRGILIEQNGSGKALDDANLQIASIYKSFVENVEEEKIITNNTDTEITFP